MDNLEDFIKNNKGEFNTETPTPDVWGRIQQEQANDGVLSLPTKKATAPIQIMKIAASFLILALAAFGGYKLWDTPKQEATITSETSFSPSQEMVQLDQYYQQQVGGKLTQVKGLVADENIVAEIVAELAILDEQQKELLSAMNETTNHKELVEALMSTYRMKLAVLQNIINLLEENDEENIPL
jgi:hypothetical protein